MARQGKIEALPYKLREEVHQRLHNGETGAQILPWLNNLQTVKGVLKRSYNSVEISDENLSNFRNGPHQEWLRRRENERHIRSMSEYANQLAGAAGASFSAGARAIAAGKLMELLETSSFDEDQIGNLVDVVTAVSNLSKTEATDRKLDLQEKRLTLTDRAQNLDEAKFQVQTCELFLKWYDNEEARLVASGQEERTVKVDTLRQMMFGENPYAK
jgi:hypothetical protein